MNPYMNQYQQNQVMTASQEQILIMLYDGAIKFCRQAIAANEAGNVGEKLGRISKTFAIITEFSNSLNHEIGGEIAADLDGLYHFMLRELSKARTDTSGDHLRSVEKLLVDLRLTWGEAVEINRKELGLLVKQQKENEHDNQAPVRRLSAAG
ncbi:flagellar export chaperone FliS [Desulfopila sp. IMCC35006]|uniref:flagellar export chaperone FliS n=1 Tax=Desulfopila sp. IMCC35006 TaxID=2569542 RepID=UPI0010AD208F|nr:flagellar export chaperone FliS [Desulfopila sp. IMCC35006]TKB25831.1 flagellar export chaperone FliS [Desulfopila sp. IMCC35006]